MKWVKLIGIIFLFFVGTANAFRVDTLFKVLNINKDNDKGNYLVLTGDDKVGKEYIWVSLTKVDLTAGAEYKETLLPSDNIASWPVIVEPGEFILDGGDELRVGLTPNKLPEDDELIGISFIPDTEAKKESSSSLQISVGYKTWLVVPGYSSLKGDIQVKREGSKVIVENDSNKILRVSAEVSGEDKVYVPSESIISLPHSKKFIDVKGNKVSLKLYLASDSTKLIKEVTL